MESSILDAVRSYPKHGSRVKVVYLANIPGDFILRNRIVEKHYAFKLYFARRGKQAFTDGMKKIFESFFLSPSMRRKYWVLTKRSIRSIYQWKNCTICGSANAIF